MKKSNKKVIAVVISSLVAVLIIIGIVFAVTANSDNKTKETTATNVTEKATQAQTQAPTEAPTEAVAETQAPVVIETEAPVETVQEDADNEADDISNEELIVPDVTGIWKNENYPSNYTVEIKNQNGNTMDITITAVRGNAAQIATCDMTITVTPEMVGSTVRATDTFEFTDSFSNTGTCSITVSENVVTLIVTEGTNAGGNWGIFNATGDYLRG